MDKSRQQFEAWFIRKYNIPEHIMKLSPIKVEIAWEAWKASRESLEVELPEEQEILDAYEIGFNNGVNRVKDILISNGVKIKNE